MSEQTWHVFEPEITVVGDSRVGAGPLPPIDATRSSKSILFRGISWIFVESEK